MSKPNNLIGQRFGRLVVISRAENNKKGNTRWTCKCDCGKTITTQGYCLTGGTATSCGCKRSEKLAEFNVKTKCTHGETKNRLYRIWCGMRNRCNNVNNKAYSLYGGRGISVCDEWQHSYEEFRDWAIQNGYDEKLTIDRIDNNGNYQPDNCRWTTMSVQNANRRHYKLKNKRRRRSGR